jgi:hypothetical protein
MDLLFFAVTATLFTLQAKRVGAAAESTTCESLKNSAFVFVKPHANTVATQKLVREKLTEAGCTILSETDISGNTIDEQKLIDQHYYSIGTMTTTRISHNFSKDDRYKPPAFLSPTFLYSRPFAPFSNPTASKATILPAKDIPVPKDKFQASFNESWDTVLKEDRACNAMDACKRFKCDAVALNDAWQAANVVKFGGGFYCGLVTVQGTSLYVFNAFFMTMRSKFVGPGVSIHCYEVEWSPSQLSWSDFRNKVLGPTDPAEGPTGSLRKTILDNYASLGLQSKPDKGDNGVHASASPFEGLAEKINWLKRSLEQDSFGQALLAAGLSKETINEWSVDPQVTMPDGKPGSVFDALEDMDSEECLAKLVKLNDLNANTI